MTIKPRVSVLFRLLAPLLFVLACPSGLMAQDPAQMTNPLNIGLPENGAFDGSDFDQVQTNNGNLHIEIPLWRSPGRGLSMYLKFVFNNTAGFYVTERCPLECYATVRLSSGMGVGLANPAKYSLISHTSFQSTCANHGSIYIYNGLILVDPEGTKHHFVPDEAASNATTCFSPIPNGLLYTDDGSGWMLRVDPATVNPSINGFHWDAVRKDGTEVQATTNSNTGIDSITVIDPNGNQLKYDGSVTPGITTDTLGRTMSDPVFNSSTNQWEITYSDSSGASQKIRYTLTNVTIASHFCPNGDYSCTDYSGAESAPGQITLPNGSQYNFTYAPNDFGEPLSATLPTGGQISWSYALSGDYNLQVTSRTVAANSQTGVWNYAYGVSNGLNLTTVTDPANNDTRYTCQLLRPAQRGGTTVCQTIKVEQFSGSVTSGQLIKTVDTVYDSSTLLVLPIRTTTTWNQSNLVSKQETDWDSLNTGLGTISWKNPINRREYGYGIGSPGLLARKTSFNYLHLTNSIYRTLNIADRPTSKIVYDGSNNIMAQAQYTYDGSALTATSGAPNHDYTRFSSSNRTRGNVTQSSVWLDTTNTWLNTTSTYNDLGHVLSTTDPGLHTTNFSYTDSWSGATCGVGTNTQAFLTQTSAPDTTNSQGATVHHRSQSTYFPCTGQTQSTRDENDILAARTGTTFTYDLALRPLCTTHTDGGQTCRSYTDTPNSVSVTATVKQDSSHNVVGTGYHDGLGRVNQTQAVDPSDSDTFVDTTYDLVGRVATVSNPHRSGSLPTDGITTYQYDALSRKVLEIPPDGSSTSNNVQTSYGAQTSGVLGLTATVTDQAGHKRMSVNDALGRMVDVWEPDPSTGSLVNETLYTYNARDNLLRVDQKGNTSDTNKWRTRTFTYDSLSRLLTANNPESGTIQWTYDSDSNVLTKKDARNVTITYNYDQLHRVATTGTTHAKAYSNGDAAVDYYFDQTSYNGLTIAEGVGHRTGMSDMTGAAAWTFDIEGRTLSEKRQVNISGLTPTAVNATLTYAYNLDSSMKSLTYPSGHRVDYLYNTAGHAQSAIDSTGSTPVKYVTSATYAPRGDVSGYVNGLTSTFTGITTTNAWNNRFQPQAFTAATQGSGAHTVISLSFNFNQGTPGAPIDNGLLVKINNGVNSSRNVNYKYDQLNRIQAGWHDATDWGTEYTVDIWGNLSQKAACDNVVCPTHTMSDSFTASANGKNQLNTYSYDASGNLQNDQLGHSFNYDGENRPYSAGGVTYYYDGEGERVAKSTGKLYLFGTGSATVVETDASGTMTAEYIFFNGKRVAMRKADNSVHYYFADQIGSANVMTNATGAMPPEQDIEYHPYGEQQVYADTLGQQYKFTGKEHDPETNNDYFGARYYSSTMGRFLTPDWAATPVPIPYAVMGNPQTLNLYSYVENNPITGTDPDGHASSPYIGDAEGYYQCLVSGTCNQDAKKDKEKKDQAQKTNGTVPVIVGQRSIRNWLAMIFSFGLAKHSYYIVLGHRFEVLGNPGSSHNQQVRDTTGTSRAFRGKEHTIDVSSAQAQALYNGSEYFAQHTGSGDSTSDYAHPCPTCTGGQEGYNFLVHNSNSFVYNMLNSDPAGRIPPPSAPVFTPGYAMKPDDWYPNP
jgi:RHS repeat-associated protein